MKYIKKSDKSVDQLTKDLEQAVQEHNFGILHVHNLQETLKNKGFTLQSACKIFEICNPKIANDVLNENIALNMALPCRISIWQEEGKTKIGMINPTTLLSILSKEESLNSVALEVEETIKQIIDKAC